MAKLVDCLEQILPSFEAWYRQDHGQNEDYYATEISLKYLSNISNDNFINFFVTFRKEGGLIQSLGERNLNNFEKMISSKLEDFRKYILEPFHKDFDPNDWLDRRDPFSQWGVGIATIYLVRVNKFRYAVLNNKTVNALKMLGFENVKTINNQTYSYVTYIQNRIINKYPEINNYYKADALCHYIVTEREGKIIKKILKSINTSESEFIKEIDQEYTLQQIQSDNKLSDYNQLLARIREISCSDSDIVTYKGNQIKRNIYIYIYIY
ncbi:MAG: hypothetical protein LBU69_03055 [Deltaproteobacteria bacterium]|jgi:hypothetical protein|nr:hypothetical protein [Deltaproteobacteria bacterium]